MVIVLKQGISQDEKRNLKDFLTARNFRLNEIVGEEETIIAAVGKSFIEASELESMPGISRVIPISKPYKMSSREFKKENTVVEIANSRGQIIRVGGQRVVAIAGPSSFDGPGQIMSAAEAVAASGASLFFADIYDDDRIFNLQEMEGKLRLLKEAGEKFGLPVVSKVLSESHIALVGKYADVFLVDSDGMGNHDFLRKFGLAGKPVILKRSHTASLEDFLMSAEQLLSSGCESVILCEHGIKTIEPSSRNVLDLSAVPVLRNMSHLPVLVDPCGIDGHGNSVHPLGMASISAGADGLMIDVSFESESDSDRSLSLAQFDKLMHDVEALAPVMGKAVAHIRTCGRERLVCAYSGKRGAYAEQAVGRYFDSTDVTALPLDSFSEIFQSVIDGKADYGMVPIENSLAGSVYQNYDNFCRFEDVTIAGAVTLNIRHALLGVKGASLEDIRTVYSHPQGFGQCKKFLDGYKEWVHIDSVSTATAAKLVSERNDRSLAAIASTVNADLYDMDILQEDIEDDPNNFTRFLVIQSANQKRNVAGNVRPNMASFIFKTKNEPGSLYRSLGVFAKFNVNLTRLESRPMEGHAWNYWFYADAELSNILSGAEVDVVGYVERLTEELKDTVEDVRLLGIYAENRP
ncbi:MAG: prephenate dehydratase [Treponema sp.]|nr:prephenate dehydratase [Treponema sp.]